MSLPNPIQCMFRVTGKVMLDSDVCEISFLIDGFYSPTITARFNKEQSALIEVGKVYPFYIEDKSKPLTGGLDRSISVGL